MKAAENEDRTMQTKTKMFWKTKMAFIFFGMIRRVKVAVYLTTRADN